MNLEAATTRRCSIIRIRWRARSSAGPARIRVRRHLDDRDGRKTTRGSRRRSGCSIAALDHAGTTSGCETRLIRLRDLKFRACEGYYSKSAHACTWPCTITQMHPDDQLDAVYEALVHWADVVLVATPIRWGSASSLYYKMAERLNCVQNQITIRNRVLIQNKVAAFIVTGGQDNVQGVVGTADDVLRRAGLPLPPVPVHRPLAAAGPPRTWRTT